MQDDRTLRTARRLPYPPEAVYAAFASGPVLATWWGPEGFTNTFAQFDFSVGLTAVDGGTQLTWDQAFDDAQTARAVRALVGAANEQNLDRLTQALRAVASAA